MNSMSQCLREIEGAAVHEPPPIVLVLENIKTVHGSLCMIYESSELSINRCAVAQVSNPAGKRGES